MKPEQVSRWRAHPVWLFGDARGGLSATANEAVVTSVFWATISMIRASAAIKGANVYAKFGVTCTAQAAPAGVSFYSLGSGIPAAYVLRPPLRISSRGIGRDYGNSSMAGKCDGVGLPLESKTTRPKAATGAVEVLKTASVRVARSNT